MYEPRPIDTSEIQLPAGLTRLVETLAENTHDHWAVGRIKQGWTYGTARDDEEGFHPCLVPYDELPDHEREFDRNTAMESIKLVIKLGYRLTLDPMPSKATP